MQGRRSIVGSLPETLGFDHGSTPSESGVDPQICWNNMRNSAPNRVSDYNPPSNTSMTFLHPTSQAGQDLSGWSIGESSSSNVQSQVSHNERKVEHGWSSSVNVRAGSGSGLEECRYEQASIISLNDVNVNLSSTQITSDPLFLQSSRSDSITPDLNINSGFLGHGINDCQVAECSNAYKSGSSENLRVPSSSSSDPFGVPSGSVGYMEEENDGRPGPSLEERRLSRKRKACEGNVGQSSGSGSSNYFSCAEGSVWHAVPARHNTSSSLNMSVPSENPLGGGPSEQVNPRLGLSVGGVPSEGHLVSNAVENVESSRRNLRLRINAPHQPDSTAPNVFSTTRTAFGPPIIPAPHPSTRLLPLNNSLDLRSLPEPESTNPRRQPVLNAPAVRRALQSARWNRTSNSRPGSSSSLVFAERDAAFQEESNSRSMPRNMSEHPMFIPAVGVRNSVQSPINWPLPSVNLSVPGNVASTSRSGSSSEAPPSSGPTWIPQRHHPLYPRRLSEFVRRSLLSSTASEHGGQSSNTLPPQAVDSASSQEMPPSSGDQGHHLSHSRSAMLLDRQPDGAFGIPYSLRTFTAANEGRSRLVSEIRNVLDLMRRGEGLRFEDVMILDQSVFFGMADSHDRHRDMRLDVDNMSYEELLALEERIGNVNTGLNEETISNRLKQRKYVIINPNQQQETEPCCICQEEYINGEDLGTLECGHDFHAGCVKQWLMHKNLCPICKTTALVP